MIKEWVNDDVLKEMKETLFDLIAIPSMSGQEGPVAEYICKKLQDFGVTDVEKQQVAAGCFNVIARIKGDMPGKTTLLTGHMDTVSPGDGWDTDPFQATEREGRIYGRGANDMKAGIAIILETAKIAVQNRERLVGEIVIALVCDEEAYSRGVMALIEKGITADFGISAEPEYREMLVGAAGKILIKVDVLGVAAHAAKPWLGVNAIEEAGKLLAALETIPLVQHEKIASQPYVTLKIDGGMKKYELIVPARCSLLINKHTVPGETKESVIKALEETVAGLGLRTQFSFSVEAPFYPPYTVEEAHPNIVKLQRIFKEVTGHPLRLGYQDGVCDNNYLVPEAGIPVVSLGPEGENLHAGNEWVSKQAMEDIIKIYLQFLFT